MSTKAQQLPAGSRPLRSSNRQLRQSYSHQDLAFYQLHADMGGMLQDAAAVLGADL